MKNALWGFFICSLLLGACKEVRKRKYNIHNKLIPKSARLKQKEVKELVVKADNYFNKIARLKNFSGSVLIAKKGEIVYRKSFGYSQIRKPKKKLNYKNTSSTTFQLASVSKTITGIAVLQLVQEGKVKLNDSIQKFYPRFPYRGITIKDLLTHYSGLSNYMYFCEDLWENRHNRIISNDSLMELIIKNHPAPYLVPRKKYNYCNTNYALLANIVAIASDTTFDGFVQKNIFNRCGMTHSFVYKHGEHELQGIPFAQGYTPYNRKIPYVYLDGVMGDKGVYSCVDDLYLLDRYLYTNVLLSDSIKKLAFNAQHKELYRHDNYGLGWRIDDTHPTGEKKLVYHGGWWKGFKTYFYRFLDDEATVIILSNRCRGFIPKSTILNLVN